MLTPMSARTALLATLALAVGLAGCDRLFSKADEAKKEVERKVAGAPPAKAARPGSYRVASEASAPFTSERQAELDDWIKATYARCWRPLPTPAGSDAWAGQVRIAFKRDGSLARPPRLVNPPSDPALKPQAKGVLKAVKSCNPLKVPAQYGPYYERWRTVTVRFDPETAAR